MGQFLIKQKFSLNCTGTVNEDATLTVADGDNANSATALSLVRTTSINSQESYPRDVTFNNDGTKMFTIGATGDDIGYYTLSTAYDTSTATHQAGSIARDRIDL